MHRRKAVDANKLMIRNPDPHTWMSLALAERGVRRFGPGETNPRIVAYNAHTNLAGYDDKVSWCASFVNWCMANAGYSGTGSALARSWLEWGRVLDQPEYGCIAVLSRDDPASWKGHVGFYLRHDDDAVYLLGGNQLDEVRELAYPLADVLGYRVARPGLIEPGRHWITAADATLGAVRITKIGATMIRNANVDM